MSQDRTLEILRKFGKPGRPCELARFGVSIGMLNPEYDNNATEITDDLRHLSRWGIVKLRKKGRASYWSVCQ